MARGEMRVRLRDGDLGGPCSSQPPTPKIAPAASPVLRTEKPPTPRHSFSRCVLKAQGIWSGSQPSEMNLAHVVKAGTWPLEVTAALQPFGRQDLARLVGPRKPCGPCPWRASALWGKWTHTKYSDPRTLWGLFWFKTRVKAMEELPRVRLCMWPQSRRDVGETVLPSRGIGLLLGQPPRQHTEQRSGAPKGPNEVLHERGNRTQKGWPAMSTGSLPHGVGAQGTESRSLKSPGPRPPPLSFPSATTWQETP